MTTVTVRPAVFVFASCSHKDEVWRGRLVGHLQNLFKLEENLEVWDDRRIDASADWRREIEETLVQARVAVLLVSTDFLISKLIRGNEVPEILRLRQSEGLRVIPVIVRPCSWQAAIPWLASQQARPKDGCPLSEKTPTKAIQDFWALCFEICGLFFAEYHLPDLANRLGRIGERLVAINRTGDAEPFLRRALAIDEGTFGKEHPNVATRLNDLAQVLLAGEAEPLMRRALAIDEAALGRDHPTVARDLDGLAYLLRSMKRPGEGVPLTQRALAIDEAAFAKEHPTVAGDLNNLATLLMDADRLEEAEPLIRRALDIFERSLGPDHLDTQGVQQNLWKLLDKMHPEEDE